MCTSTKPLLQLLVRLELSNFDAVDGQSGIANLLYVVLAHLAYPEHAVTLQTGTDEVDVRIAERFVEGAAANQYEVDEVAGEFEQQAFRRVELPGAEPVVRKPNAVII